MDKFQKKFHVKLAIWMGDGQKLCEKSALHEREVPWPPFSLGWGNFALDNYDFQEEQKLIFALMCDSSQLGT